MSNDVELERPMIYQRSDKKALDPLLEDGGTVTLSCSNCDKPLVVIWTRSKEKVNNKNLEWNLQAKCCYCGDKSFKHKIIGGFYYKGYDKPHPNGDEEDVIPIVNVVYPETSGDVILFITEKAV